MRSKAPAPTAEEWEYMGLAKQIGCVPCWLLGRGWTPCDYHHCLSGNKRRGHLHGYGNCLWHHRGEPWLTGKAKTTREILGPSLKLESKAYHARFGSEDDLIQCQRELIEKWRECEDAY